MKRERVERMEAGTMRRRKRGWVRKKGENPCEGKGEERS